MGGGALYPFITDTEAKQEWIAIVSYSYSFWLHVDIPGGAKRCVARLTRLNADERVG